MLIKPYIFVFYFQKINKIYLFVSFSFDGVKAYINLKKNNMENLKNIYMYLLFYTRKQLLFTILQKRSNFYLFLFINVIMYDNKRSNIVFISFNYTNLNIYKAFTTIKIVRSYQHILYSTWRNSKQYVAYSSSTLAWFHTHPHAYIYIFDNLSKIEWFASVETECATIKRDWGPTCSFIKLHLLYMNQQQSLKSSFANPWNWNYKTCLKNKMWCQQP